MDLEETIEVLVFNDVILEVLEDLVLILEDIVLDNEDLGDVVPVVEYLFLVYMSRTIKNKYTSNTLFTHIIIIHARIYAFTC